MMADQVGQFAVGQTVILRRDDVDGERAVIVWFDVAPNGSAIAKTTIQGGSSTARQ